MATTVGTKGRHVLAEYWECDFAALASKDVIADRMAAAAKAAGATIVATLFHQFTPTGVSGVVVIEESHLSIHTWPEEGYAAADFYTCGDCVPEQAMAFLRDALSAGRTHFMTVDRGLRDAVPSFKAIFPDDS